jgi:hypothetical protein
MASAHSYPAGAGAVEQAWDTIRKQHGWDRQLKNGN